MTELKFVETPVVDCSDFDAFVEEVFGRKYSTVNGCPVDERGHHTYYNVDSEQWKYDNDYMNTPEAKASHAEHVKMMKETYPHYREEPDESVSFAEWKEKEGWNAHNDCPVIDEMVWHLINLGYDVPAEFTVLMDW